MRRTRLRDGRRTDHACGRCRSWLGNVIIIEHTADDGTKLRSLYGHLETIAKIKGKVKKREHIATIGSSNGRYKCHLHFEIRWKECPLWDQPGPGYSDERYGWIDPSEFIEKTR